MPSGAIFHFDVGSTISSGHALAASAYRERTGDYADRGGHVSGGLVGWDGEACDLWAAAERADTPKRKRVEVSTRPRTIARQITIALPDALDPSSREKLVRGFALHLRDQHGIAVQWDIHAPGAEGDARNHHAHIMFTTRKVEGNIFGAKTRELNDRNQSKNHVKAWREEWANRTNRSLERSGSILRISHLSRAEEQARNPDKDIPAPRPALSNIAYQKARRRGDIEATRKRAGQRSRKHQDGQAAWAEARAFVEDLRKIERELAAERVRSPETPKKPPAEAIKSPGVYQTTTQPPKQPRNPLKTDIQPIPRPAPHPGLIAAMGRAWDMGERGDLAGSGKLIMSARKATDADILAASSISKPNISKDQWVYLIKRIVNYAKPENFRKLRDMFLPVAKIFDKNAQIQQDEGGKNAPTRPNPARRDDLSR